MCRGEGALRMEYQVWGKHDKKEGGRMGGDLMHVNRCTPCFIHFASRNGSSYVLFRTLGLGLSVAEVRVRIGFVRVCEEIGGGGRYMRCVVVVSVRLCL